VAKFIESFAIASMTTDLLVLRHEQRQQVDHLVAFVLAHNLVHLLHVDAQPGAYIMRELEPAWTKAVL
jgi:hypothetical protein